jgi:hypothetical protein
MKAITIQESAILIPNKEHKNFTETSEKIEKGQVIDGQEKYISGLRRGKPFTYKLFVTNDNKIIYLKTIKPMATTEVTLGADAAQTPTVVNLRPAEKFDSYKLMGVVIGGLAGFAYCRYKKCDLKKSAMYIGIGAGLGFLSAYLLDDKRKGLITPSK